MANEFSNVIGPQPAGLGNRHIHVVKAVIDTYTAGGVAIEVPASITKPVVFIQTMGGYGAEWDDENKKVKLFNGTTEATTVDTTVFVMFIGQ